jgi:hypothetical protein
MKWLLTIIAVNCLISVFLYPMLTVGVGRPMSWLIEAALLIGGLGGFYLLIRYRSSF